MLADAGIGTRSEIKKLIKQKKIRVNERIVTDPGLQITDADTVYFQTEKIERVTNRYLMLHKPAGCVSATVDQDKTVLFYIKENTDKLFPVGRLDKDTEGLLLLTDDGHFAHMLMSPKRHVAKTYYFEAEGNLAEDAQIQVLAGLDIGDDALTLPGILRILSNCDHIVKGELTIYEGRYHQVKRMMKKLGVQVTYLKRLSIGKLELDPSLEKGAYRSLTQKEMELVFLDPQL